MGLFSKILQKIGIGKKDETATTPTPNIAAMPKPATPVVVKPVAPAVKSVAPAAPKFSSKAEIDQAQQHMHRSQAPAAPVAPTPISEVDVVAKLEEMGKGKKLDWKVSIVDLLKLLELDSSFESRKELAVELGCPASLMGDSAKMNVWLHKTVLKKIAENGGNIPQALLN